MIQNGQEFGEDRWLMENDEGCNRRVKPRPLRWDFMGDKIGRELMRLYSKFIRIREAYSGLRSPNFYPGLETWQTQFNAEGYGVDVARQLAIFHRWGSAEDGRLQRSSSCSTSRTIRTAWTFRFQRMASGATCSMTVMTTSWIWLPGQEITSNWGGRVYCLRS